MSDAFAQFEKRLESLERKHRELAEGYVARINPDGLITVEPKRQRSWLPVKLIATAFIGVALFKVVTLFLVGQGVYEGRVAALAEGTAFEKAAAWVLQADEFTRQVVAYLTTVVG